MTDEKKMTIRRIVIFLVLATLPPLMIAFAIYHHHGTLIQSTAELRTDSVTNLYGLGMLFPAIAHLLTRLLTRQGWKGCLLQFSLRGNYLCYLLAAAVPLLCSAAGQIIAAVPVMDMRTAFSTDHFFELLPMTLYLLTASLPSIILMFGEEFGWRAYLMPELEKMMSTPASVVICGILWGLWHAPITALGHNFGTDYAGFPYLGILFMCVECIANSAFLTLLVKKTGSVWSAVIGHGFLNTGAVLILPFVSDTAIRTGEYPHVLLAMLVAEFPILLAGIVSFVILCIDSRKAGVRLSADVD